MAQWLRAFTTPAEDLGSPRSIQSQNSQLPVIQPPGNSALSLWPLWVPAQSGYTHICT